MNLVFALDHVTDVQNGKDAKKACQDFLDGLKYSELDESSKIYKMAKECVIFTTEIPNAHWFSESSFKARFMPTGGAGVNNGRRFFDFCETYAQSVVKEAELRERGEVLGLEEFTHHRRNTSGVMPCFSLGEIMLGIDLDDKVYGDPTFRDAYLAAVDHIFWSNVREDTILMMD